MLTETISPAPVHSEIEIISLKLPQYYYITRKMDREHIQQNKIDRLCKSTRVSWLFFQQIRKTYLHFFYTRRPDFYAPTWHGTIVFEPVRDMFRYIGLTIDMTAIKFAIQVVSLD